MALTPPGSPYVESSDLVANYPAVSESLAERVDLVGVLPFASAAARTTALPTPTDGQYSYLQDTNSTEVYNGVAWVAAGVAPGLVHINTTTFSAVSSVSLNDVFTASYNNYKIIISEIVPSAAPEIRGRLRVAGTDNSASVYDISSIRVQAASVSGVTSTDGSSWVFQSIATGNPALYLYAEIFNPFLAVNTGISYQGLRAESYYHVGGGHHTASTSFDGISFFPSTGTFTGTIRVYGYKNS